MPTGYTAAIADGITFEQFALSCARAFGACIEMRDDPADAPIPDEFKPSTYHKEGLARSREELAALIVLTPEECEVRACEDYKKEVGDAARRIEEANALKAKYLGMLEKVNSFTTPTGEHEGFKKFMQTQITESIDWDCSTKYATEGLEEMRTMTGEGWRQKKIARAQWGINYHTENDAKETEQAKSRTLWISQLREAITKVTE